MYQPKCMMLAPSAHAMCANTHHPLQATQHLRVVVRGFLLVQAAIPAAIAIAIAARPPMPVFPQQQPH